MYCGGNKVKNRMIIEMWFINNMNYYKNKNILCRKLIATILKNGV